MSTIALPPDIGQPRELHRSEDPAALGHGQHAAIRKAMKLIGPVLMRAKERRPKGFSPVAADRLVMFLAKAMVELGSAAELFEREGS